MELFREDHEEGMRQASKKAMYSARDAAQSWGLEHAGVMTEAGFKQGMYSAHVFYRKEKNLRAIVHGEHFTVLGPSKSLRWLRGVVRERLGVKFKYRLERGKPGAARILTWIMTEALNGPEHEADQRHAGILMRDVGSDESSKEVVTPGVSTSEGGQVREERVGGDSRFRAVAARWSYLGQNRMDMQFAANVEAGKTILEKREEASEVLEGQPENCDRAQVPEVAGESCGVV